ncbi:MAG TPA: hypothetical protein VEU96_27750 [Bryobacteraceae bacterium]|nr:hypothetical protein [Bryobacteraceae bacterium]
MKTARYVHWQNGGVWLGYLEEFPDYMTQVNPWKNSKRTSAIFTVTFTSGEIPGVRKVAELTVG